MILKNDLLKKILLYIFVTINYLHHKFIGRVKIVFHRKQRKYLAFGSQKNT